MSTLVIINFHGGKNQFFLLYQAQIYALAMRARVTLSLDWLAFAVKLVLVDSCIWKIARVPCAIVQLPTKTSFTANANQSNESVTRVAVHA